MCNINISEGGFLFKWPIYCLSAWWWWMWRAWVANVCIWCNNLRLVPGYCVVLLNHGWLKFWTRHFAFSPPLLHAHTHTYTQSVLSSPLSPARFKFSTGEYSEILSVGIHSEVSSTPTRKSMQALSVADISATQCCTNQTTTLKEFPAEFLGWNWRNFATRWVDYS